MIYYVTDATGAKTGSTNYYKITCMFPDQRIDMIDIWLFEGYLLNFEWLG